MSKSFSLQECINQGEAAFNAADLFFGHGTDNAADEALWLAFFYLQLSWDSDSSVLAGQLSPEQYQGIQQLYQRRIKERIPAAYITGEAWFMGLPFIVNQHVLVPRSPLAECVASGFSPFLPPKPKPKILDLCTGSGCIGIASAIEIPQAEVFLSDISPEALDVAHQNIHRHQLEARVTTVKSDLFENLQGHQFDLIVSNPPYVDADDFASRPAEYRAEPDVALESGVDGLDFTRRLLVEAADYLKAGGTLIVELGNSEHHLVEAYPHVPFLWLDFEYGGHGVFAITREDLQQYFLTDL